MKKMDLFILSLLTIWIIQPIYSQSQRIDYEMKKGEVFDVLVQIMNPNNQEAIKRYLKEALPIAKEYSYQNLPGFKIREHTAGNLKADQIILGKWDNLEQRLAFADNIIDRLPDFHEQRRDIWAFLGLAYFTIESDLSFEIDKAKYNVITTYWAENKKRFGKTLEDWKKKVLENGGEICLALEDGQSTQGYLYEPDFFLITSWENATSFENFERENNQEVRQAYKHINQFVLN